ncbi:flocculation protein FLO11 isoform X1 [Humulus lupulus]|uniref:flocculation protein FLO11 isoform X1 n=1 Tax=Humulus lupulus TaxID=3486 RepID=UPI002B401845|nr:flocculation protein FLO11 isoform X1 [Humulus lupulus]
MMRYQRVSPDCLPLTNGTTPTKKPNLTTTTARALCREDDTTTTTTITASAFRFRSPSSTQDPSFPQSEPHDNHRPESSSSPSPSLSLSPSPSPSRGTATGTGTGDMLLQWGHKKRSRVSRTEIRNLTTDESSSSAAAAASVQVRQRRLLHHSGSADKLSNSSMPPPPPPPPPLPSSSSNGSRARKEALLSHRNLEDRTATNGSPSRICGGSNRGSGGGGSRSTAGKSDRNERKVSCSARLGNDKPNGSSDRLNSNHVESTTTEYHATATTSAAAVAVVEKVNVEALEWPRIFLSLSRKEKEDDFLAMKGTKLPQRPKKRPKNIDRALQYCFPGMWLSDLTRNRYEVREKKCVKKQKQRRGLKGMESVDSDSE